MHLDSVSGAIDYLALRYKLNDAGSRARCLAWLQQGLAELWLMQAWWFRQVEVAVSWTAGVSLYTVDQPSTAIVSVIPDGGGPLAFLETTTFGRVLGGSVVAGPAQFWTERSPHPSSGLLRYEIWPVPAANGGAVIVRERVMPTLADNTGSPLGVPEHFRAVVLAYAEEKLAEHDGQLEVAALKRDERGRLVGAMMEENRRRAKWRP